MLMSESDFLVSIADLSIALLAFTTIVVALRQMVGGGLGDFQVLVVKLFSLCGFSALFFGLLPIVMAFFEIPAVWIWRICNVLLGAAVVLIHVWYFKNRKRISPHREFNATNIINLGIMLIALVLLALGTLGVAFDNSIAPYAFALVGLLVAAATAFLRTLADFVLAD
jgi:hypothetical protein